MSRQALMGRALMTLAILFLTRLPGEAQTAGEEGVALPSGTRVRVTLADGMDAEPQETKLVGQLTGLSLSALSMDLGSAEREIPRGSIVRLERSIRPSRKGRAALIGFGLGFAAIFGLAVERSGGDCVGEVAGQCIVVSALLALPAAAVGAIVAPGEQWTEVPLPPEPLPVQRSSKDGLQLRIVPLVGRRTGLSIVASF